MWLDRYYRSCEVCQRSTSRKPRRIEMVPKPLITRPCQRIALDIVGPLRKSKRGNRCILTLVDYSSRYPDAIALPSTEASRLARELVIVFSRVGILEEILSDQGANFMSGLLQSMYQLLDIKHIRTSPYHPQTDGLAERFNGTLKTILKKFVDRRQSDICHTYYSLIVTCLRYGNLPVSASIWYRIVTIVDGY